MRWDDRDFVFFMIGFLAGGIVMAGSNWVFG
jgi:hypothetical protein